MVKYIYLCGPIRGLTVLQAKKWRDDFKDYLFSLCICLDPTRDHQLLLDASGKIIGPDDSPISKDSALVSRDLADIRKSCLLVANFSNFTANVGSLIEIGYAHALNIPIILIIDPAETFFQHHPFIKEISIATFYSTKDAVQFVRNFIGDV